MSSNPHDVKVYAKNWNVFYLLVKVNHLGTLYNAC